MSDLQKIAGIGPARAAVLTAAGYGTPEAMAAAGQAVIADLLHINEIAAAGKCSKLGNVIVSTGLRMTTSCRMR